MKQATATRTLSMMAAATCQLGREVTALIGQYAQRTVLEHHRAT